ncbi:diguanylate cyclase [Aquincola sp. S2]|uniref:diguanylate cyclase n=1 Tax=Pseudaquabacterium terrae TaxID=2732868 RepID=A0ABX2E9W0_9BURK|nr:diguanylate cyclase [Aquabacterium terrae]NRF65810.1 diguanylate cyclase [Aquabacterium terrae]
MSLKPRAAAAESPVSWLAHLAARLPARLRERRLGPRLLTAIVLASTCLALVATAIQLYLDYSRELTEIDAEFRQIESSYLGSLASSLWSFDRTQTQLQIEGLLKLRDVQFAAVRGETGEQFQAGRKSDERSVVREFELRSPKPPHQALGSLTVAIGLQGVYGRLFDRTLVILTTQATKTFFIALLILFIVSRWVTRHLEHMARHARGMSVERLSQPLALPRRPGDEPDELDEVATALNEMSRSLSAELSRRAQADQELKQHRDQLVEAVADLRVAEEKYRSIFENAIEGIFQSTPAGRILTGNPAMARMLGYAEPAELLTIDATDLYVSADDRQRWRTAMEREGSVRDFPLQLRRRDGQVRWVSNSSRVVRGADGQALYYEGTLEDVTERRQAEANAERLIREEAARQQAEAARDEMARLGEMVGLMQACATLDELRAVIAQQLPRLFEGDDGALYLFEPQQRFVAIAAAWGMAPSFADSLTADDCWALRRGRPHLVEHGPDGLRCRHVDRALSNYACLPLIAQGEALGFLHLRCNAGRPIAQRRPYLQTVAENLALGFANVKLREALRHEAIRDPLTGLYNRRFMNETLERACHSATRTGRPLALLLIDIDHFKRLNDSFGHDVGDRVLREVAKSIAARIRSSDLACRFGGEEFLVILPDTALEAARAVAEVLCKGVRELALSDSSRAIGQVTISLGVASFPQHGSDRAVLTRAADAALYQAKGQGRDRVVVATAVS